MVAGAVVLYIISPFFGAIPIIIFDQPIIGGAMMFVLIALATGMLIYNHMMQPQYLKKEETVVEDFKQWRSGQQNTKEVLQSLMTGYWGIVVAIYLIVSFVFCNWAYSWILFIIAGAICNIIKAVFYVREGKNG